LPAFRKNILPPSSGRKGKPNKESEASGRQSIHSSETPVYRITQCRAEEINNLHVFKGLLYNEGQVCCGLFEDALIVETVA
jgi:hypothetical protein